VNIAARLCYPPLAWHIRRTVGEHAVTSAQKSARSALEPSDEALMAAYATGDRAAFSALFGRYSALVWRALRRGGIADDVARDLVQQTFLQLHRARRDFRPDKGKVRPWLMTIAYNVKRDYLRSKKRRVEVPLEAERHVGESADPGGGLDDEREARRVREAVAKLPPKLRDVIEMHWFMELPFADVADALGVSRSAAKVRAHRAYKKLKEMLADEATS
jgi:RNA polymerase sigma-70 factor (ECF subfamily)